MMKNPVSRTRKIQAYWSEDAPDGMAGFFITVATLGVLSFIIGLILSIVTLCGAHGATSWFVDLIVCTWWSVVFIPAGINAFIYHKWPLREFKDELNKAYKIYEDCSETTSTVAGDVVKDIVSISKRTGPIKVRKEAINKRLGYLNDLRVEDNKLSEALLKESINSGSLDSLRNSIDAIRQTRKEIENKV